MNTPDTPTLTSNRGKMQQLVIARVLRIPRTMISRREFPALVCSKPTKLLLFALIPFISIGSLCISRNSPTVCSNYRLKVFFKILGNEIVKNLRRIDLARATGCNLETIRYYEKIGLMPNPPRSTKGYRMYDGDHVSRLAFIMRARELGFALGEVRSLLGLVDGGVLTCAEVKSVAQNHLKNISGKMADLRKIELSLSETISRCSGNETPECAVIDALSANWTT